MIVRFRRSIGVNGTAPSGSSTWGCRSRWRRAYTFLVVAVRQCRLRFLRFSPSSRPDRCRLSHMRYALRHDIIINRTLVYGPLSLARGGVCGGRVGLQSVLRALTARSPPSQWWPPAGHRRAVQPAASAGAGFVDRASTAGSTTLQRPLRPSHSLARGDGPRRPERRRGGGGWGDDATRACLLGCVHRRPPKPSGLTRGPYSPECVEVNSANFGGVSG